MNDDEIIKRKVSLGDIIHILNRPYPVRRIRISQGAFNFLPKKAIATLNRMKIRIEVINLKRGPKTKINKNEVYMLYKSDLSAYEISKRLKIPLRTVYYHISKIKKEEKNKEAS